MSADGTPAVVPQGRQAEGRKPDAGRVMRLEQLAPASHSATPKRSRAPENAVAHRLTVTETRSPRGAVIKLANDQVVAAKLIVGHRAATWYIERAEILGDLVDHKGTFPTYEDAAGYARRECERIRTDIAGGADGVRCQS